MKEKIEIKDVLLNMATEELAGVLRENLDGVLAAYQESIEDNAEAKSYSVGLALVLRPYGSGIRVNAKISYGVKHTDETEGQLASVEPDLFSGKEKRGDE